MKLSALGLSNTLTKKKAFQCKSDSSKINKLYFIPYLGIGKHAKQTNREEE
jgi:hypothetical protein